MGIASNSGANLLATSGGEEGARSPQANGKVRGPAAIQLPLPLPMAWGEGS